MSTSVLPFLWSSQCEILAQPAAIFQSQHREYRLPAHLQRLNIVHCLTLSTTLKIFFNGVSQSVCVKMSRDRSRNRGGFQHRGRGGMGMRGGMGNPTFRNQNQHPYQNRGAHMGGGFKPNQGNQPNQAYVRHRSRRNPIRTSQRYSHLRCKAQAWPSRATTKAQAWPSRATTKAQAWPCRATTKARRRSRLPAPLCRRSSLHCRRMPSRPRTLVPHRTSIERTNPKVGWEMAKSRLFPQRKTQSRHHPPPTTTTDHQERAGLRLYYFIRGWGKIVLFLVRT